MMCITEASDTFRCRMKVMADQENHWIKALGVDFGEARIGLATSDDLGLLAHPYQTISGKPEDNPVEALIEIIHELSIQDLVIGLPLHSDGRASTTSKRVIKFIEQLRKHLGEQFPIHQVDELMTTKIARQRLEQSKKKFTEEELKKVIDQAAAVEILQDWLNQKQPAVIDGLPDDHEDEGWC